MAAEWSEVGSRVRQARLAASLTQGQLAQQIGLERSAVARIESGERRVDALELRALSNALDVPLPHLVSSPLPAIVSRRTPLAERPDAASRATFQLDVALEQHHRDAALLIEQGHLTLPARPRLGPAADHEQARDLAGRVRDWLSVGDAPLGPLAEVGERLALLLLVVDIDADGASVQDDTFGVAVVGGRAEPGRRRATAAHELGHHLLGDEYSSDVGIAASRDDREQLIEAFAAELLLPRSAVEREVQGQSGAALRARLIEVAGRWRVSWSLAAAIASAVLPLPIDERRRLLSADPTRADFISALGQPPQPDLEVGDTGPAWRRAVLAAFGAGDVSGARAVELLHGLVTEDDLPDRTALTDVW